MSLIHLSRNIYYRNPYGAVPCNAKVLLRCDYSNFDDCPILNFRFESNDVKRTFNFQSTDTKSSNGIFTAEYCLSPSVFAEPGLYFYYFSNDKGEYTNEFQITVFESDLNVPDWFLNTIIYQIFPDRFYKGDDKGAYAKPNSFIYSSWDDIPMYIKDNNQRISRWEFFGGNLKGISQKIPYIQSLGVDTVYLNPIFDARSNHRYDTADYHKVDSLLGGDEAFDSLIEQMNNNNIHIILDGVFNHTGKCSKYFKNCKNPDSPYKDWFCFRPDGSYDCWWGVDDLPAIDKECKSFAEFVAEGDDSVVKYWSRKGISGWRLDVADELSDNLLQKIRAAAESEIKEPVIIGEVWENASNKMSYGRRKMYFTKRELHTHTNYVFRDTLISFFEGNIGAFDVTEVFECIKETYPKHNFYAQVNMTGSHDVERLMTLMLNITNNDIRLAKDLVKCYSLIQFTSVGVPLVYYGDETCVEGGKDPDNRRTYPWSNPDYNMIGWFSYLADLRRQNSTFVSGDVCYFYGIDANGFGLLRFSECDNKSYLTVCDRFGRGREVLVPFVEEISKSIEILKEKSYIIEKEAGGYGMLVSFS